MFEIAICDDSMNDRNRLRQRIEKFMSEAGGIRIHEYASGQSLLEVFDKIRFSIIFLDVQMKGLDGEETAIRIRKKDYNVLLVFYTGYVEPSPRSFEVQPYRYIMKNMSNAMMDRYIKESLGKMIRTDESPILTANMNREVLFLRPDDIIYIEKYKKNTRAHISDYAKKFYGIKTNGEEQEPVIRIKEKLDCIYEKLRVCGFGYPHDSYLINFKYLIHCTSKTIRLKDVDNEFQISRSKALEFNKLKDGFMLAKY